MLGLDCLYVDYFKRGQVLVRAVKEQIWDYSTRFDYSHTVIWILEGAIWFKDRPGNIISERDIHEWVLTDASYSDSVDVADKDVVCGKVSILERLLN